MTEPPFSRLGIVGLGLIGGSIALRARVAWPDVTIVGLDRAERAKDAERRNVVHRGTDTLAHLATCDLIVLATPVASIVAAMPELSTCGTAAVVTDVGSTKRQVMAAARAAGMPSFVGGHPMGGSEHVGLDYARPDLFDRRPWLLVSGSASVEAGGRVERFARGLGATPHWTDADTHDRTVAYVSHLPQIMAVALMNATTAAVGPRGLDASGRAFAEMTRLASSPPDLWREILADNADFVAEALARFVDGLPTSDDLASRRWVDDALARAGVAKREMAKGGASSS